MSTDLHDLCAAYALDALDAHERSRFETHLEQCETCREELAGFHATTARLFDTVHTTPPPELRERLLTEIGATTQQRPVTFLEPKARARRMLPRLAVAASVLVAAGAVGGYLVERDRASDLRASVDDVTTIMAADDATMIDGAVSTGGGMRVVRSNDHDAAVVMASDLKQLDSDHVYQVWAMHDGVPRSVGILGRGAGMVFVPELGQSDGFALTVEPDGGSPAPTTDPVAAMEA